MNKELVPADFKIPEVLETDRFRLRPLVIEYAEKDYDAIMTSIEYLSKAKTFGPWSDWPVSDLTLEEDKMSIEWHEGEAEKRAGFAFTVMSLDDSRCLGCAYIYPSDFVGYDAVAMTWVRQSEVENGLDGDLFLAVKKWIAEKWPFEKVAYPGRDVGWDELEVVSL